MVDKKFIILILGIFLVIFSIAYHFTGTNHSKNPDPVEKESEINMQTPSESDSDTTNTTDTTTSSDYSPDASSSSYSYVTPDGVTIYKSPSDEELSKIHQGMHLSEVLEIRHDMLYKNGGDAFFANGDQYFFDDSIGGILENISGPGVDKNGNRKVVVYGLKDGKVVRVN